MQAEQQASQPESSSPELLVGKQFALQQPAWQPGYQPPQRQAGIPVRGTAPRQLADTSRLVSSFLASQGVQ